MSSHHLQTAIEIEADPGQVWAILTDFAAYPEWNPFVRSIEGDARPGALLSVRVQPRDGGGMTFRPTVLVADAHRELRWLGGLPIPGLFEGEHGFVIEPIAPGRVRFH